MINYIIKRLRMDSGTILHLALLKKLSSSHPQCNYSSKFNKFRNRHPNRLTTIYQTPSPSITPFQKYPSTMIEPPPICKTSRSSRPRKHSQLASQLNPQKANETLCGWSIENNDKFNQILESSHLKNRKLPLKRSVLVQKSPKTYLRRNSKSQNYNVRKLRTKLDSVIIEPIFSQSVSQTPAFHFTPKDKQNISSRVVRKLSNQSASTSKKPFQGLRLRSFRQKIQR